MRFVRYCANWHNIVKNAIANQDAIVKAFRVENERATPTDRLCYIRGQAQGPVPTAHGSAGVDR